MGYSSATVLFSLFIFFSSGDIESMNRLANTFRLVDQVHASRNVEFEEINHKTIFKNAGRVYGNLAYGHLVASLNITEELHERQRLLEQLNDGLQQIVVPTNSSSQDYEYRLNWLKNYTKFETEQSRVLVDSTEGMFANLDHVSTRQKRQLAVLASAVIGGVVSSLITEFGKEQLVSILQQKVDCLASAVEESDEQIAQNKVDIERLKKTLKQVLREVSKMILHDKKVNSAMLIMETTIAIKSVVSRIRRTLNAIETIRSGTFSTDVASPQAFKTALSKLSQQAIAQGRMITIENILDLNLLSSSYLYVPESKLIITFAHIAFVSKQAQLSLYKYLETPTKLSNDSKLYSQVNYLQKNYIAINDDQSHYMPLSLDDLLSCEKMRSDYFCPNLMMCKRERQSCILALYLNNHEMIRRTCELSLTKFVSEAYKISKDSYIWSETEEKELTVICDNFPKWTQKVHGTFKLKINAGCKAFTNTLTVRHPKYEPEVAVSGLVFNAPIDPRLWFDNSVPEHYYLETANELLNEVGNKIPISQVKQISVLKHKLASIKPSLTWWQFFTHLGPGGLFSQVIGFVVTAAVLYVVFKVCWCLCNRATAAPRGGYHGQNDEHEMQDLTVKNDQPDQVAAAPSAARAARVPGRRRNTWLTLFASPFQRS